LEIPIRWPHENKIDWSTLAFCFLGTAALLGRRSADGHLEPERNKIEDYTGDFEKHPCFATGFLVPNFAGLSGHAFDEDGGCGQA
jgi:hypothetical protein